MSPILKKLHETYETLCAKDLGPERMYLLMGYQLAIKVAESVESEELRDS
jgi:hypothetical protein